MTAAAPRRLATLAVALATTAASLLATSLPAGADTTTDAAAAAFGITDPTVVTITGTGNITAELARAVGTAATAERPTLVQLRPGSFTVKSTIVVKDHVYLAADPATVVTWTGTTGQMLWFSSLSASGVTGGTWDGARRSTANVFAAKASTVLFSNLTVRYAGKNGIAAYLGSKVTLRNLTTTANNRDGAYLEGSSLDAVGVLATRNLRNGIQLSSRSSGTLTDSYLYRNGAAVTGSTTGKTGHGLGVASSQVAVANTTISRNKVCGVSLTGSANATITASRLDTNGRHGLGTTAGARAAVSDSTVTANGYNGVLASGSGTAVSLTRVTITDSVQYGLSVPTSGRASIAATSISRSGKINVSVSGRGRLTVLGDNIIRRARSHGIAVSGKGKLYLTGTGNHVRQNRGNGLLVSGYGTSASLSAPVHFTENGKNGILVNDNATVTMVPSVFSGNAGKRTLRTTGGKIVVVS